VKFAFDTNIYVDAFRDPAAEAALLRFIERALPFTFLSAVVMQELAAGARTPAQARELERSVFQPFVRRRRVC
jgi:predicted nucleic acid-binding protein